MSGVCKSISTRLTIDIKIIEDNRLTFTITLKTCTTDKKLFPLSMAIRSYKASDKEIVLMMLEDL